MSVLLEDVPLDPAEWARLSTAQRLVATGEWRSFTAGMTSEEAEALLYRWSFWRRPSQVRPAVPHRVWLVRAGRGFGKTRTGAETVRDEVREGRAGRLALVAPTAADCRDVLVEGESGLLAVHPRWERPEYEPSKRRLTWPNGAVATLFSADEPERLRGPQSDLVWGDEPASWRFGEAAFDNANLGCRLGRRPWILLTGTPKPTAWLRKIAARRSTVTTTGSTFENTLNLAAAFIEDVIDRYQGSRLGRQELDGEWLEDVEGALWAEAMIEAHRLLVPGGWVRARTDQVVVGVDPPGETAECGIVVVGGPKKATSKSHAYVLDDMSTAGRPEVWGARVVAAWKKHKADVVLVESNQGGDMVRAVVHAVDPDCPVEKIRAKESKADRAEPVSTNYQVGRVHHVGRFALLESQMVTWVPDESASPDRLDALVHAVNRVLPSKPTAAKSKVRTVTNRSI